MSYELVVANTANNTEKVIFSGTETQCQMEKTKSENLAVYTLPESIHYVDTFIVREVT